MPDREDGWMDKMGKRVELGKPEDWNTEEDEPASMGIPATLLKGLKDKADAPSITQRIMDRVAHARQKHPDWLKRDDYVLSVAEMEWHEFVHALSWEGRKRAEEEALDLIAVLVRFIEGDAD